MTALYVAGLVAGVLYLRWGTAPIRGAFEIGVRAERIRQRRAARDGESGDPGRGMTTP